MVIANALDISYFWKTIQPIRGNCATRNELDDQAERAGGIYRRDEAGTRFG